MLVDKLRRLLGIIIISFPVLFLQSELAGATAISHYPLQIKYPNTMIYKAETNEKVIAFTFDDAPDEIYTPQILDVLKKHDVKATFFLLGARVKKYPHIVKRIYNEGHIIGNHTYWHPELTKTGVANMVWEINENEKAIKSVLGFNTNLFRAPYGALNEEMVRKLKEMGYQGIGWSIDSEDWKGITKGEIKANILEHVHPGSIVLMHAAGNVSGTPDALEELITYLKKNGYYFVTVEDLWKLNFK